MPLILKYLRRHWLLMVAGLLILLVCSTMQVAQPLVMREVFNDLQQALGGPGGPAAPADRAAPPAADGTGAPAATLSREAALQRIWYFFLLFLGLTLAVALTRVCWRIIIWPLGRRMEYEIRRDLFEHMRGLPPAFFHGSTTGDLMSRATSDIEAVRRFYSMGLVCFFDALLIIPASFVLMARMDLPLALAAASPLLLGVPLSTVMMRRFHARYKAGQDSLGELTARVQEDIAGVRAIKTYAREAAAFTNFERANADYTDKAVRVSLYDALFEPYFRFVPQIGFIAVIAWGGWKLAVGQMRAGDLVMFLAFVEVMIWPIFASGMGLNMLQRARASAGRLEEIFAAAPDRRPPEEAGPERIGGDLSFRGLTFAHRGKEAPAVADLNLEVPAGTVLGITGPTGSGKSTLLNLAAGLLTAPKGTVFLDGTDLGEVGRGKLRRAVTLVEQTPFLFSRSLEDNLAYGRENCPPELVREAVSLAALDGDVERFEQGLATVVGERGVTLSGGQRLRAALARALVVEPRVLLLDDVFSAVDVETEKAIWRRLRPKLAGTTVIVVSHRISVLRECDRVVVIQEGRLSESGTHQELLRGDGFYARTFALQEQFES
jgi:ATP-binding cassette subfamily B multidrug efflux pump